jgi:hypothetical protein
VFEDDTNGWITDTAVSVHITPHQIGLSNLKNIKSSGVFTIGIRAKDYPVSEVPDIKGIMKTRVRIHVVAFIKNGRFNLLLASFKCLSRVGNSTSWKQSFHQYQKEWF